MGASWCCVFESEVPGLGTLGGDNRVLLDRMEELDRWAAEDGLAPLSDFESYDPEDVEGLMLDEEGATPEPPPLRWFAASEGLAAVKAMLARLTDQPNAEPGHAQVRSELEAVARELAEADRAGVRFRFAVVG